MDRERGRGGRPCGMPPTSADAPHVSFPLRRTWLLGARKARGYGRKPPHSTQGAQCISGQVLSSGLVLVGWSACVHPPPSNFFAGPVPPASALLQLYV